MGMGMGWFIFFCLAVFIVWKLSKGRATSAQPPRPQEPPPTHSPLTVTLTAGSLRDTDAPQWRDPLDEIAPDSVVYNGYKSAALRARIHYTDGQGRPSEREVDIVSYDDTTGIGMFEGFCHLRGARRSFYFARVARAVDAQTGEIIDDLRLHLNRLWEQGTGPALRLLRLERGLELEMLLFMAKADKALRAAELEIITRYCQDVTGEPRLDAVTIRKELESIHLTTLLGFKQKFGTLANCDPGAAARVAALCRAIVATQKTVHPDEQAALEYLDRKMPQAAAR